MINLIFYKSITDFHRFSYSSLPSSFIIWFIQIFTFSFLHFNSLVNMNKIFNQCNKKFHMFNVYELFSSFCILNKWSRFTWMKFLIGKNHFLETFFFISRFFLRIFMDYVDYIPGVHFLFSQISVFDFSEKHLDELFNLIIIRCSVKDTSLSSDRSLHM